MVDTAKTSSTALRFETPRLIIRPHTAKDAALYAAWDADEELAYLNEDESDNYEPISLEEARAYLRKVSHQDPETGIVHFGIEKKETSSLIGFGMLAFIEPHHRRAMIGVTIGEKSEWGKGFAREALIPVLDWCFEELKLNRVYAEIYCFNDRSRKLFEGLGFKYEGTRRQSVWKQGEPVDDCMYGLLREDWEQTRGKSAAATT